MLERLPVHGGWRGDSGGSHRLRLPRQGTSNSRGRAAPSQQAQELLKDQGRPSVPSKGGHCA